MPIEVDTILRDNIHIPILRIKFNEEESGVYLSVERADYLLKNIDKLKHFVEKFKK